MVLKGLLGRVERRECISRVVPWKISFEPRGALAASCQQDFVMVFAFVFVIVIIFVIVFVFVFVNFCFEPRAALVGVRCQQ